MSTLNPSRQETAYDPEFQEDPVHDLTLLVQKLRLGERVRLPDGTMVVSRAVQVGPHQQRRFSVVPPVDKSTPKQRHQALVLGHHDTTFKTAEAAAAKALKKESAGAS